MGAAAQAHKEDGSGIASPPMQGDFILQDLEPVNDLEAAGKIPFHLSMTFQLFSIAGAPSEKGTLEFWWSETAGTHLDVTTSSLGTVHDFTGEAAQKEDTRRALFLIQDMFLAETMPAREFAREPGKGSVVAQIQGFRCLQISSAARHTPENRPDLCVDNLNAIRFIRSQIRQVLRDRIGSFSSTKVPLKIQVLWGGRNSIEGHVEALKSFNPATEAVALLKPGAAPGGGAGKVIAGTKLAGPAPYYPVLARQNRIQGTVVLFVSISQEGKVTSVTPIASPDPSLTASAAEAVSK